MITKKLGRKSGRQTDSGMPGPNESPHALADLTFIACIERTALGELWKVRTAEGKAHLCQFLPPNDPEKTETLWRRLQAFRHRALVNWNGVRDERNRLALLAALEGPTLWDRFQELWSAKQPGVPREELLGYLRSAAMTLDLMQARHHVQHLWLHPRQLVLQEGRARILGFGLAETWWAQTKRPTAELNPRYSAPELYRKARGAHCDQYSLALIYAEMLTGTHPWRGRRPASAPRGPDLALLPRKERAVLERALSPNHRQRFDSATQMFEALASAAETSLPPPPLRSLSTPAGGTIEHDPHFLPCKTLDQFVHELVSVVGGDVPAPDELALRFTLEPSRHLESPKFLRSEGKQLPVFDDFCRQWHAKTIRLGDGLVIMAINAPPSVWQWLSGRRLGLEVRLEFLPVPWGNQRAQVAVAVKPFGCDRERAAQLLMELGPKLLQSVRKYLHGQPEQRDGERRAVRQRLRVSPVINGNAAKPLECITKDISPGGIGFFLPVELPASQVYVNLPEFGNVASYAALAQVVRKQPAKDGWFEVGAAFPITTK